MKILHVINSLGTGGAEKLITETLPEYQNKNFDNHLIVFGDGVDKQLLDDLISKKSITIVNFNFSNLYNPFAIIRLVPFLQKYDLCHVHLFPALYYVYFAKLISFSKIPLLFTEHSTKNRRQSCKLFKLCDYFVYRGYTKIICISEEIREIMMSHTKLPKNRFVEINNGVNLSKIYKAKPLSRNDVKSFDKNHSDSDIYILQVSSMKPPKDQESVIRAISILPDDFKLILVGDGEKRKFLEKLIIQLSLQNRVFLVGKRMDVPRFLKFVDVVILSSKYEGLSLSSIEGMASGSPFISTRVAGLEKIVEGYGLLFDYLDYKELARILLKVINDLPFRNMVIKKCIKRSKDFDLEKMVLKHIEIYNSVINLK